MSKSAKYLFGPVPSRRLGLSLGVDIVPLKTCSQNCIYCQLGRHGKQTLQRKPYVAAEAVLAELKDRLAEGLHADCITFSGSGEPTLNSDLGRMIDGVRSLTDIRIAVITNGTLFSDPQVRSDCCKADVVLPSLDAGDPETFDKINRPRENISFETFVDGLCQFRRDYAGPIWLEVFFLEGVNTRDDQVARMRELIARIRPDKVHLNTAVRPTAEPYLAAVDETRLHTIADKLDHGAEVIADFARPPVEPAAEETADRILEMLRRRPCSLDDMCRSLGISAAAAVKHLEHLTSTGKIRTENAGGKTFYVAN
ncbi:MAG TPA: radical SAM protein [Anaerohalosphaeraceae bacterium]|nr:radical SAM protein [Anaerohalosphaeraceae bacterium]HRT51016.1 radical SAM protein [Anaerohalosphaeraceae bacterium]HRT87002.1 radical SAM protein [Anaerohalosphaeraceae bacterium]